MRPGGGKQKGADFEREVCKKLSLWVSRGEKEDLFWRSAMSGGRATVYRKQGKGQLARQAGDITATAPEGHVLTDQWYIECKFVADLRLDSWLLKDEGDLARYWTTAKEEAKAHGRDPMMIVKQNRGEMLLVVPCGPMMVAGSIDQFNPLACLARLFKRKADIFHFESVLVKPFIARAAQPFLKPGEIAHILGPNGSAPKGGSNGKRRRDGLVRRIREYAEAEIQDAPGAAAESAIPLRVRAE
jgi:hypothetical protein